MTNIFKFLILFSVISCSNILTSADDSCGDWEPFEDEKCFKTFAETSSYERAKTICRQTNASLITIKSPEEQQFLENLIFKSKGIVNSVWLGMTFNGLAKKFQWNDNSVVVYKNWAPGQPKNDTKLLACVMMEEEKDNFGKWVNKQCGKSYGVVCEKMQGISMEKLRNTIREFREKFKQIVNELEKTKQELKKTNEKLAETTPPGTIAFFGSLTPPKGWLEANSQEISRANYSSLFNAIGTTFGKGNGVDTFQLPDLRGEFVRGWSRDRDVDKHRVFGSFQWGSNVAMAGYVQDSETKVSEWDRTIADGAQDRWEFAGATFDGGFEGNVVGNQTRCGTYFPKVVGTAYYGGNMRSGNIVNWNLLKGTRPRNVALLACIKH